MLLIMSWESSLVQKTRRSDSISTSWTFSFGFRMVRITPLEMTVANSPLAIGILLIWGRFSWPERGLIVTCRGGIGPACGNRGGGVCGVTPEVFPAGGLRGGGTYEVGGAAGCGPGPV